MPAFAKMLEARKSPWDETGAWGGKGGTRGPAGVSLTGDHAFAPMLCDAPLEGAPRPPAAVILPERVFHALDLEEGVPSLQDLVPDDLR